MIYMYCCAVVRRAVERKAKELLVAVFNACSNLFRCKSTQYLWNTQSIVTFFRNFRVKKEQHECFFEHEWTWINTNTQNVFLNTNGHEYTRIHKMFFEHEWTWINTNTQKCFFEHELPWITHEFPKNYLWLFSLKRKTWIHMNTHEYEKIKFMKNSWVINDNSFSRYAL